jgi:hypothetical protein
MANNAPTTKSIADILIASFEANYGQQVPVLKKAFLRVTSKVLAGLYIILYKYAGFLGLQMFVDTMSSKPTVINGRTLIPLVVFGRQIGVSDPALPVPAQLEIEITVTNQTGSLLSGSQLLGSTNGVTYITQGETVLNAATVTANVVAVDDQSGGNGAGEIGNLEIGDTVSFISPLANVQQATTVTSQILLGVDGEDLDTEYRARVKDKLQKPPQGGAYADYVIWGLEPNGIVNIYPYTGNPGEVDVYSEATVASSGSPDGIPTDAQLLEVYNAIQLNQNGLATRRPASSFVNVYPISRLEFSVNVVNLSNVTDVFLVENEIELALTQYFLDREPYIPGLSIPPRKDLITLAAVGGIVDNVVSAFNGTFSNIELLLSNSPISSYALGEGVKAKLGTVNFL